LGLGGRMQAMQQLTRVMQNNPGGQLAKVKAPTGKRLTTDERERLKKISDKKRRQEKRKK